MGNYLSPYKDLWRWNTNLRDFLDQQAGRLLNINFLRKTFFTSSGYKSHCWRAIMTMNKQTGVIFATREKVSPYWTKYCGNHLQQSSWTIIPCKYLKILFTIFRWCWWDYAYVNKLCQWNKILWPHDNDILNILQ